jgi:bifunctional non-homologous end joining protein LigD
VVAKEQEPSVTIAVDGHDVSITNPSKVLFPEAGHTKLDLANYYSAVADGALRGAGGRPNMLKRYPNGIAEEFFYQKRAPSSRPAWIEVVTLKFPSGRTADEVVLRDAASLLWIVNLACLELHPHPVRAGDLDHPDELRVDLDPVPGVKWDQVRNVAAVVKATLEEFGLTGWPKTSGSRGVHVSVRIRQKWTFDQVRRAALALAREVERRAPALATSKWWKEERHGVFIDYNQNAKDRTVASAYSVRPVPDARVSAPVSWEELETCDPADFTLRTMPARFKAIGDRHNGIDSSVGSLDGLFELAERHAREGLGDAPWPPHYRKQKDEPPRVQPSKANASRPRRPPRARTAS